MGYTYIIVFMLKTDGSKMLNVGTFRSEYSITSRCFNVVPLTYMFFFSFYN